MQKITPFLWFDDQAVEAAKYYTSLFPNSRIKTTLDYDWSDSLTTVDFQLAGLDITAMNAGPMFSFTPSTSFFVTCPTADEVDRLYASLSEGGATLMPLQAYPFSDRFAWVNDRYGLSWQLMRADGEQTVTPFLMFVREQNGKAEEAINFYTSLFSDSGVESVNYYGPGMEQPEDNVVHARFRLHGQPFLAMDGGTQHEFTFTEAFSLYVDCQTQEEVDELWEKLTDGGDEQAQACGWLKDRYGVSWQIVPRILMELLQDEDPEKARRVSEAMLQMKKLEIDELKRAYAEPQPQA